MRALGAAVLVAAAMTALTSCSALTGSSASAAGSSASGPVLDPSIPSASTTESIAADTPLPTATAPATEAATSAPTTGTPTRTVVTPFITTADWDAAAKALDVGAIVPGVVERGGTCTVTITSGATTRTATADGVAASSYTGCEAVTFTKLAAGAWQVKVAYTSSKSVGTSAVSTAQVG